MTICHYYPFVGQSLPFRSIHDLFRGSDSEFTMQDQRFHARFRFRLNQQIAVMPDGCMPSRDDFFSVPCANISRTGFAFYQETKPTFTELVVALGVSSEPIYLTAKVIFASLLEVDGKPIHRIGCQFTGRAQWSDQTQSFLRKGDIDAAFQLMSQ